MIDIAKIIESLNKKNGNNYEFVVKGNPTTEEEYNNNVDFVSSIDINGFAIFSDTKFYTWSQIQTELPLVEFNNAMEELRTKRNALLEETDYIVIKAKETGATIPTAWKTYRQALRDITNGLTTVEEVEAVIFPEKP
jgi:hypothetical protein